MSSTPRIFAWILAAACIGAAAYFAYQHFFSAVVITQQPANAVSGQDSGPPAPGFASATTTDTAVVDSAPRTAPPGSIEYRNAAYHLSLFYPDTLQVKTYDEGAGASTITFQNTKTAQGFQLFIVPYASSQISQARFLEDEPSGVMQSPLAVTISGVPATSFYGSNALLGDTAEIWFLRGGYLYEATAPKSEVEWFASILKTLEFTGS